MSPGPKDTAAREPASGILRRPRRLGSALANGDGLRNFTVRFLRSALARVDSVAKPFYGGRLSTGEALRRLAEDRLDQIERSDGRESTQQALQRLLAASRCGEFLPLADLRWLAQATNVAYQRCKRDFVSRELLVANVSAFAEALRLAERGRLSELGEGYFLRNLRSAKEIVANALPQYLDEWILQLADRPTPAQAEAASRNLIKCLRDAEFASEMQLAKTLAPYVPALLDVAIRGYWDAQGAPLLAPTAASTAEAFRTMTPIIAGNARLRAQVRQEALEATVELLLQGGQIEISVRNVVELEDLTETTRLAATGVAASAGSFEWVIGRGEPQSYTLSCGRARLQLKPKDFESLRDCLESLARNSGIAALIERLRFGYGRI